MNWQMYSGELLPERKANAYQIGLTAAISVASVRVGGKKADGANVLHGGINVSIGGLRCADGSRVSELRWRVWSVRKKKTEGTKSLSPPPQTHNYKYIH